MYQHKTNIGRRIFLFLLFLIFLAVGTIGIGGYFLKKQISEGNIEAVLSNPLIKGVLGEVLEDQVLEGETTDDLIAVLFDAMGFSEKKTYLLLFLNNTEIRPGGGFIGSYGVIEVNKGKITVVKVEGTEILDAGTPVTWKPVAPQPVTDYLKTDRWFFRDSNWSPDFALSSQKGLEFYRAEGGTLANEIDAVIGVTPTVLEELLKIVGPITVDGINFTSDNLTERLEYEVEYGYVDRGIAVADRKKIVSKLMDELVSQTKTSLFSNMQQYIRLLERMAGQKQLLVYSEDQAMQESVLRRNWAGQVLPTEGNDYLMWVDANLGALKTDHIMARHLTYTLDKTDGVLVANATMNYRHQGGFDWRTSQYMSYVRIYVPTGAVLQNVYRNEGDERIEIPDIDTGVELGKTWYGTYIKVQPGTEVNISFIYQLPESLNNSIDQSGMYKLRVQKQAGTLDHGLTVEAHFDTTIVNASPAEQQSKWGDSIYQIDSNLSTDQFFTVGLR